MTARTGKALLSPRGPEISGPTGTPAQSANTNHAVNATLDIRAGSDNRIAAMRDRRGIKQAELAQRLRARGISMSRGQLANLESGTRKVDLPELREIALELDCAVVDLLTPNDAPLYPTPEEQAILGELRALDPMIDPRAVLEATKSVIAALSRVRAATEAPRSLPGDPGLARELAARWSRMDDAQRRSTLQLVDTARALAPA